MFNDIAYDCALRTRLSLALGKITMEQAKARAAKIAAFLPAGQDRECFAETWLRIATA